MQFYTSITIYVYISTVQIVAIKSIALLYRKYYRLYCRFNTRTCKSIVFIGRRGNGRRQSRSI